MNELMKHHMREMMTDDTVFITPVGSRLYGLENENSDYDYLQVFGSRRRNSQSLHDEFDVRKFSWVGLYEMLLKKPTHTGLEALYSPFKMYGPAADTYTPFLSAYRPSIPQMLNAFVSTALGTLNVKDENKFKRFRLGLLLAHNFNNAKMNGGFYNPHLEADEASRLTEYAEELFEQPEEDRPALVRAEFGMY